MNPNSLIVSLITLLAMGTCLAAKVFYVAPDGLDTQTGSFSAPFATLTRAQESVRPGDTVFIRGGIYKMSEAHIAERVRNRAHVICLTKSGKPDRQIRYLAYQNERPVFDFSEVKPRGLRVTAFHVSGSHLHLKGLSVTGVQVTITGHTQSICIENQGSHNLFEQLQMHDSQAIGFWLGGGSHNLVLNCDAYRNYDFTSGNKRGGNVDGFGFHVRKGSVGNTFRGCRAWFNSDDGFDLISTQEALRIENCWAFYNGFDPSFKSLGDGVGFKLGGYGIDGGRFADPLPRHSISRSVAARNKANGFYANHNPGGLDLIHNTAFQNRVNFNMLGRNAEHTESIPGFDHKMKNNLGYKGSTEVSNLNAELCDVSGNSFTMTLRLDDNDFLSLDHTELMRPRKPDGGLPDIGFMHLKAGNPAIDQGVDIGLPFHGKAPDLGAFEHGAPR